MPDGLRRFQETNHSHFVTFSCWHRRRYFKSDDLYSLFVQGLEAARTRFNFRLYGYVVMPEHVHLLLSEPTKQKLADAIHYLKLSFAKRARGPHSASAQVSVQRTDANLGHTSTSFWEKRYHDRNVRDYHEFGVKLRYLHNNPVKRGLVESPEEWPWSSYRHYALREPSPVELESEWTARDREQRASEKRVFLLPTQEPVIR
jgi:putative transposase